VLGGVGPEPAGGLLELPLAANAVSATRLIPGNREVDEPLIEVALLRGRRPPSVLQLLVGAEEFASADQL